MATKKFRIWMMRNTARMCTNVCEYLLKVVGKLNTCIASIGMWFIRQSDRFYDAVTKLENEGV